MHPDWSVAAAFHNHNDFAAVDVAEFGVGVRSDDTHLLDCVWAWRVADSVVDVLVDIVVVLDSRLYSCSILVYIVVVLSLILYFDCRYADIVVFSTFRLISVLELVWLDESYMS